MCCFNITQARLYSPNKGGTTEGGFLLTLHRIAPAFQDFRPSPLIRQGTPTRVPQPEYLSFLPSPDAQSPVFQDFRPSPGYPSQGTPASVPQPGYLSLLLNSAPNSLCSRISARGQGTPARAPQTEYQNLLPRPAPYSLCSRISARRQGTPARVPQPGYPSQGTQASCLAQLPLACVPNFSPVAAYVLA